ncbi:hypothetical protein LI071_17505 [Bacillus subtilis]|uniref:hypothetical protein n=1 Tax=Bacillus subtilis TaxID=1423 RepID=UPI001D08E45F|nr:hypothetical protein [Bacillus subtilis]MCB7162455.1 hypothetical protein [Bacillus subtilis]MCB7461328.1 hypothetical protein [Bacillus subtilis]
MYSNNWNSMEQGITQDFRQLGPCVNKWATITFWDGLKVLVYPTSVDLIRTEGFIPRNNIRSVICQGKIQPAETCINQVVLILFPNGFGIGGTLKQVAPDYIHISIPSETLVPLIGQVEITC